MRLCIFWFPFIQWIQIRYLIFFFYEFWSEIVDVWQCIFYDNLDPELYRVWIWYTVLGLYRFSIYIALVILVCLRFCKIRYTYIYACSFELWTVPKLRLSKCLRFYQIWVVFHVCVKVYACDLNYLLYKKKTCFF